MKRLGLSLLLALGTTVAQAQLYNPDVHSGFPSYAYCHEDRTEYAAQGSGVSASGDQFSDKSTTSTFTEGIYNVEIVTEHGRVNRRVALFR